MRQILCCLALALLVQACTSHAQPGPLGLLKSRKYAELEAYYSNVQKRYETGALNDEQLYTEFRALYEDAAANERYFTAWAKLFPQSYPARLARGAYYYRMAWFVRGEKLISETPPDQIQEMQRYAALARPDLLASFEMTHKPYLTALYMLNLTILVGPLEERQKWFEIGTQMDPENLFVRQRWMFSLQPRWGGSYEQMNEFLADCKRQHLPERTLAKLRLVMMRDIAEETSRGAPAQQRYAMWGEILNVETLAGEPPSPNAVMGRARAAWDMDRRAEADEGLKQLEAMHVDSAWILSTMGWMYTQEHRLQEAWPALKRAAELDDAWSQFAVGKTIYQGCADINVPADREAGLVWIRRAAEQNFAEARDFLRQH
jgi:hypothetical protein